MKNELAIKIYEIDYSFIIKNYLDPQMWQKEWTLFVYKDKSFVIYLSSIDTRNKSISFTVRSTYIRDDMKDHDSTSFSYSLGNSNIESLKRQIRGAIESLIETMEKYMIRSTPEYKRASDMECEHRERLEDKAKDFLDSQGVFISEIRDAYIDYYCNKMDYNYTNNILNAYNHDLLFDVYMIYYKASGQTDKFEQLREKYIRNHKDVDNVIEELDEQIRYMETDDYQTELNDNLESVV